jgi:hypothetical protein
VHQRVIGTAPVLADAAIAALAIVDDALPRAKLALDLLIGQLVVKLGLNDEACVFASRRSI